MQGKKYERKRKQFLENLINRSIYLFIPARVFHHEAQVEYT